METIQRCGKVHLVPSLSNNLHSCAVAIVAEVEATSPRISFAAARIQWISLAYLQIMERVLIIREAPYVVDENVCHYGYGICGLQINALDDETPVENSSKSRKSEILKKKKIYVPPSKLWACST